MQFLHYQKHGVTWACTYQFNSMSNMKLNCFSMFKKNTKLTHEAYLKQTQENIVIRI